jgi:hypothetical protein
MSKPCELDEDDYTWDDGEDGDDAAVTKTALGFLCKRSTPFVSFDAFFECLLVADNSVQVVSDGLVSLFLLYGKASCPDIVVAIGRVVSLLDANLSYSGADRNEGDDFTVVEIFHYACKYLKGELVVAVVSLFLNKYSLGTGAGLRGQIYGTLPIHHAAQYSTVDVLKELLSAFPIPNSLTSSW